ncbi:hypothetical protein LTSEMIN_1755 [Salmonella enterica subsp. enterica serovar Minnesota str. A4-603]|nr:hypothetical protein LTSEMIN_1755 [Salmonella enterica subsp. enterica serovar Minnesota str. A4-603]
MVDNFTDQSCRGMDNFTDQSCRAAFSVAVRAALWVVVGNDEERFA